MVASNVESSYDNLNAYLSKSESRRKGLLLLRQLLDSCSSYDFEQRALKWIEMTLKACNKDEMNKYGELIYENLATLFEKAASFPQLTKAFANNHLTRLYETFEIVPKSGHLAALYCIETCVRTYPGPSSPFAMRINKFVKQFIDSENLNIVQATGKCLLQMQQMRSQVKGCENAALRWKNHQLSLLGSLYSVLIEHFSSCEELISSPLLQTQFQIEALPVLEEPTQQARQVYIRFRNLTEFFKISLCGAFPVAKSIYARRIINFISRVVATTQTLAKGTSIFTKAELNEVLPRLHRVAYELLEVLLLCLKRDMLRYQDIIPMFTDTLKWTANKRSEAFIALRTTVYELVQRCCETFAAFDVNEATSEVLLNEIRNDILPRRGKTLLNIDDKKKDKTVSISNEVTGEEVGSKAMANDQVCCVAALRSLQSLLTVGIYMSAAREKYTHAKIFHIVQNFNESKGLYSFWQCRLEIYKILRILAIRPKRHCLSPAQNALYFLQRAQFYDKNNTVRLTCTEAIRDIEIFVHPRKETLIFPINYEEYEYSQHCIENKMEKLVNEELETSTTNSTAPRTALEPAELFNDSMDDSIADVDTAATEQSAAEDESNKTDVVAQTSTEEDSDVPMFTPVLKCPDIRHKRNDTPPLNEEVKRKKPKLTQDQPEQLTIENRSNDNDDEAIDDLMDAFVG